MFTMNTPSSCPAGYRAGQLTGEVDSINGLIGQFKLEWRTPVGMWQIVETIVVKRTTRGW